MFFKSENDKSQPASAAKPGQPQMQPPPAPSTPRAPSAAAANAPRPSVGSVSTIGDGISIKGDFKGEGELRVEGLVDGKVDCHTVVVGEHGTLKGTVKAKTVVVSGTFDGNAEADRVTLTRSADVQGEITVTESIEIETGARFEGNCRKVKAAGSPASAAPAASKPAGSPPALPGAKDPASPGAKDDETKKVASAS